MAQRRQVACLGMMELELDSTCTPSHPCASVPNSSQPQLRGSAAVRQERPRKVKGRLQRQGIQRWGIPGEGALMVLGSTRGGRVLCGRGFRLLPCCKPGLPSRSY